VTAPKGAADTAEIRRAIDVLHRDPNDVIEIRAIRVRQRDYPTTTSGYFDDRDKAAAAAASLSPISQGVYINLHRINPALLARADNRLRGRNDDTDTASDRDTIRRLWVPIDIDAKRPAGTSSSEEEHQLALDRASEVLAYLSAEGWNDPVVADSGNGAHLLYAVDQEPADGFTREFLKQIGERFSDDRVQIDEAVFNPGRIWKLYGTLARKGDSVERIGRVHRLARLIEVPDA
jgi:hypothetical protein